MITLSWSWPRKRKSAADKISTSTTDRSRDTSRDLSCLCSLPVSELHDSVNNRVFIFFSMWIQPPRRENSGDQYFLGRTQGHQSRPPTTFGCTDLFKIAGASERARKRSRRVSWRIRGTRWIDWQRWVCVKGKFDNNNQGRIWTDNRHGRVPAQNRRQQRGDKLLPILCAAWRGHGRKPQQS